ncbi:sodium:solute symporter family protein [Natronobacterium gregoryi]|uniref:Na+/proline symporter n=2 Tax=Natronobacterium gregoryi TaxID=44930 RepID=L0AE74_NATGS|nr:sodium:solute symporter family protein [Natronobacterium gregoryi]AFZ72116.1 Na+/proline symporter [Natronobacterium gregoryi SP2]PLK19280.1 sodium:solute symporter family protein [Natronobacterium gregoryi SP2]SFJ55253.1 solute:Na+ symporter, SSS family [Natronobacterium gregoryi]
MVEGALSAKVTSLVGGSILFFALMLYVGSRTQRWVDSASDFLVSGREINAVVIAFGLAAIGLAGSVVSGVPEYVVEFGFVPALSYMIGWVIVVSLFGLVLGPVIRRTGVYTTPEWMEQRFDRKTRVVTAIGSVLAGIAITASQFVGIGAILAAMTDVPFWQTTLAITVVTLIYMYLGGLWAVTVTDVLQMVFGFVAFALVAGWLAVTYGGPTWLLETTPAGTFSLTGTDAAPIVGLGFDNILTWTLAWVALVVGNQYYWIRIVSARSERDATRGPILGGLLGLALVTLLALPGAYAFGAFGDPAIAGYDVRGIIGLFILELPIGLDALLLVALVAAVMSTASTTIIGTTTVLIRDVWEPVRGTAAGSEDLVVPSRAFTLVLGVLAWILAAGWAESALLLLGLGMAFVGPLAAVILLGLFWPRTTGTGAFAGVLVGIVTVAAWEPTQLSEFAHATYPGVLAPAIVTILVSLVTSPPYYGSRNWRQSESSATAGTESGTDAVGEVPDPEFRATVRELAKPWTPSTRWNRAIETRGRERGGLVSLLVGRGEDE